MSFPKVRITGGPHSKNLTIEIDGVKQGGVHKAEVTFDVNDVARLRLWQIIEADLDIVAGDPIGRSFKLRVYAPDVTLTADGDYLWSRELIGEYEGDTTERVFTDAAEALADYEPLVQQKPVPRG